MSEQEAGNLVATECPVCAGCGGQPTTPAPVTTPATTPAPVTTPTPITTAPVTTAPSGCPLDANCFHAGENATCGARIQWLEDNRGMSQQEAGNLVATECAVCKGCGVQPAPTEVQQLNERCGGEFGACNPELVCVGDVSVCMKPSESMQYKQLGERCSLMDQCSPNGLLCHRIDEDYYKCIKDMAHTTTVAPVTTSAPVTTATSTSTAPVTTSAPVTTTVPVTTATTTTESSSKCFVCYWNCQEFGSNWETKTGAWENAKASHCANAAGTSTCFCYGSANARACYDSFSQRSGISCSARRLDIIV